MWGTCRIGSPATGGNRPVRKANGIPVAKHRRLSPDTQKLIALFISAIEPIARLIDVISRIR